MSIAAITRISILALIALVLLAADMALAQSGSAQVRTASPELQVSQIGAAELAKLIKTNRNVQIFDVRESSEFAVSRLRGAKHLTVASNEDREKFLAGAGRNLRRAAVVFYCTIGARSFDFAQSVQHELLARGATSVHVLKGGVFAWHNEGRELVDHKGRTQFVHPYNDEMKQQLKRPAMARLEPRR